MTADKHVGERIRALRLAKGMTLQQVAAQTGLTASFLSQMERNLSGVTLSSLVSVSKALGVALREIVTQPPQITPDTHQGERQEYSVENVSLHYERLSASFPGSCLHALKIRIPKGYSSGFESHAGEELLFVLSGDIEYTVDHKTYRLGAGDSMAHRFAPVPSDRQRKRCDHRDPVGQHPARVRRRNSEEQPGGFPGEPGQFPGIKIMTFAVRSHPS